MVPASRGSEPCGHVDAVTFFQGHDSLLHVRQQAAHAAEVADLSLADQRIDPLDLDVEQFLHRFLDLRLSGVRRDSEDHLVALRGNRGLLGVHRRYKDDVWTRTIGGYFTRT